MAPLIGIDTGGTYTDAVIFSETDGILAKAKALTTKRDLSFGIGEAIDAAMQAAKIAPVDIAMVAMSTTLATNAIVEGLGDRVGLVLIGFQESDLLRAGLRDAVRGEPVLFITGGHDAFGSATAPLDAAAIHPWLSGEADTVSAFAVAGQFSIANPRHELTVSALLADRAGKPVICSHELSAQLNAPRRALTALLNARLIGIIHHLLDATDRLLQARSIRAAIMVVKGDGSLISAGEARRKPIETILSGPAASIVGASYLTGLQDALVADIGGTTTDIAILRDGRPRLDERGAKVGGWLTMVEAVAVHTIGLGGDSEVRQDSSRFDSALTLGPRRVIPVSLLASQHPDDVHEELDRQSTAQLPPELAGRFAVDSGRAGTDHHSDAGPDAEMLTRIGGGPVPLLDLIKSHRDSAILARLVSRGAVVISAFTPSDASHILGLQTGWDRGAAEKAAALFARKRTRLGDKISRNAEDISRKVIEAVTRRSAESLLDASFAEDGEPTTRPSTHPLIQNALEDRPRLVRLSVQLSVPIVALGAAAGTYYPAVARQLDTTAVIPDHADVANAIGAVVGHVRVTSSVTISRPRDDRYRVHLDSGPEDFEQLSKAVTAAERSLQNTVTRSAEANGVVEVTVRFHHNRKAVVVGRDELLLEMIISATATGRPSLV